MAIVIEDRETAAAKVNQLLSSYGEWIVGRMGVPYRDKGISVIALIVDGDTDTLGAMTGKIGSIPGVKVRSALA